jgi:phasin
MALLHVHAAPPAFADNLNRASPAISKFRRRETGQAIPCYCARPRLDHHWTGFPMDHMKPFEVPADMRKFAEQSVEQARQAFDRFVSAAHEALAEFEGRAQAARSGAMDVGGRAMSYAERNMAASFDFAQNLVKAKDVEEVVRLQTEYVKAQVQALNDQTKDLAEAAAKLAKDAASSKPL